VAPADRNDDEIRRRLRGIVSVCTLFLAVSGLTVAACVSDVFSSPDYRSLLSISQTYRCLMAAEVFFVVFLWPAAGAGRGALSVPVLAALVVISAPLVAVAAYVSNTPAYTIALTHLLLLAIATASVSGAALAERTPSRPWRWYYLAAVFTAGAIPLAHFLMLNLTGVQLPWLGCISPFWAMELTLQSAATASKLYWAVSVLIFTGSAAVMHKL